MSATVYVEGGGQGKDLRTRCREGFHEFLRLDELCGRSPRIVACGTRADAYDRFCTAVAQDPRRTHLLLVDSEDLVHPDKPRWQHVRERPGDAWAKPPESSEEDLHFMAVCMESWLVADAEGLERFYGQGFARHQLPHQVDLERVEKANVLRALARATRDTRKGAYSKGRVSFAALGAISASVVRARMPHCEFFLARLSRG